MGLGEAVSADTALGVGGYLVECGRALAIAEQGSGAAPLARRIIANSVMLTFAVPSRVIGTLALAPTSSTMAISKRRIRSRASRSASSAIATTCSRLPMRRRSASVSALACHVQIPHAAASPAAARAATLPVHLGFIECARRRGAIRPCPRRSRSPSASPFAISDRSCRSKTSRRPIRCRASFSSA